MANATRIVTKNSITPVDTPSDLTEGELAVNIPDQRLFVGPTGGGAGVALNDAAAISYNNTASDLSATNIQTAVDELDATLDTKGSQADVDEKANTADLGELAYEDDVATDAISYVRKDKAWSELPSGYTNPQKFIWGRINENGSIDRGSGDYTVSLIGNDYTITFDTPITEPYLTLVSKTRRGGGDVDDFPVIDVEVSTHVVISGHTDGDSDETVNFNFMVYYVDVP